MGPFFGADFPGGGGIDVGDFAPEVEFAFVWRLRELVAGFNDRFREKTGVSLTGFTCGDQAGEEANRRITESQFCQHYRDYSLTIFSNKEDFISGRFKQEVMRSSGSINISDEERKFLLELADRRRNSFLTPEPVLLSLVRKGLIQFDLSTRGNELAKELIRRITQR